MGIAHPTQNFTYASVLTHQKIIAICQLAIALHLPVEFYLVLTRRHYRRLTVAVC
ncbi:MAG: hypothetical protein V7K24_15305 [Nostoc sp.]